MSYKILKQKGLASIFTLIGMVVVSIILPVATKLVEQNQENRSKAAVVADGGGGGSLSSCSSKNGGFCAAS
ncbi:MAG: hypothetical protein PHX84_03560, partial [Candidatus Shapirobacteria bacterium]|nr:hypothetical protein [Candidatus Shapirobacteria bacterium]